jgi:hypothetical protein
VSLIFNTVSEFVETVGRRTTRDKVNTLDRISTVWTGPSALAIDFLPANKTQHPQFQLMYCERAVIGAQVGLTADVNVDYVGKLSGIGIYRTTPDIDRSRHLGSISYSDTQSLSAVTLATTSWVVRFTARGVSFRYLTNQNVPADFDGYFATQAAAYLGVENVETFRAGLSYATGAPSSGYINSTLVYQNDLVDLSVKDLDNGWYELVEQYLTQAYINSQIVGAPGQSGSASTVYQYPNSEGTGWAA